jgi:hypothetical protein
MIMTFGDLQILTVYSNRTLFLLDDGVVWCL